MQVYKKLIVRYYNVERPESPYFFLVRFKVKSFFRSYNALDYFLLDVTSHKLVLKWFEIARPNKL
ncbi:hypothetical protein GCM10022291_06010 [Postechiella marina]|uniref:Uncharacterized protein n=1 Tax=Postechiella marina TaxID=943941 RepID=A0ABP8C1R8_9FLAO